MRENRTQGSVRGIPGNRHVYSDCEISSCLVGEYVVHIDFGGRTMMIRKYHSGEEVELLDVFISSVRENAKAYYNENQLKSWAPDDMDLIKWQERIKGINPFVVVDDGNILGYADLQDTGYIDHFFIRGGLSGRGIGRILMQHIIEEANKRGILELTSDVSLAAQGFFEKFGFKIVKRKKVVIRGAELQNVLMSKNLK